jgi:hypothetical protein
MLRKLFRTALAVYALRSMLDHGSAYAQNKYHGVEPFMEPLIQEIVDHGEFCRTYGIGDKDTLRNVIKMNALVEIDDSTKSPIIFIFSPKIGGDSELITSLPLLIFPKDNGMMEIVDYTVYERSGGLSGIDMNPERVIKESGIVENTCECVPDGVMKPQKMTTTGEELWCEDAYRTVISQSLDECMKRQKPVVERN